MKCSRCGILLEDTSYEMLTPIIVEANPGEEGYAKVTMVLCDDNKCLARVLHGLVRLGFKDHRHGGANFLEDEECPGANGMKNCPTPSEFDDYDGEFGYLVGNPPEPVDELAQLMLNPRFAAGYNWAKEHGT